MPLFSLPVSATTTSRYSNPTSLSSAHLNKSPRKRKRSSSSSSSDSDSSTSSRNSGDIHAASTNPLALTPDEIAQYKLAGLSLDEELPSERLPLFPHKGLDANPLAADGRKRKGKDKEGDEEDGTEKDTGRGKAGPRLRVQHLSVLTTILQRCLIEGDIVRAGKAWSLLLRTSSGGQGIDLRGGGYWGIGAEVLIGAFDSAADVEGQEESGEEQWKRGSKEGLERVKEYFERLILQFPYKRHFDAYISALDFWPQMIACEIYGIQKEEKIASVKIEKEEDIDDGEKRSESEEESDSSEEAEEREEEDEWARERWRKDQRMKRRKERRWVQRNECRIRALSASEKVAGRLNEVMTGPPYSDNPNLLRLRGMLALYIGDLSVPALPEKGDMDDEAEKELRGRKRSGLGTGTERRLLFRQRVGDHEKGLARRKEYFARAKALFESSERAGGDSVEFKDSAGADPDHESTIDDEDE